MNFKVDITSEEVEQFILTCGESLNTFTYFEKRPFSIIRYHLITTLLVNNGEIVGYGHLDKDNDKIWLGIVIHPKFKKCGYGKKMMQFLIANYETGNHRFPLYLTVHKKNRKAQHLFNSFHFKISQEYVNQKSFLMFYRNSKSNASK